VLGAYILASCHEELQYRAGRHAALDLWMAEVAAPNR
jgi:hypothetical protein